MNRRIIAALSVLLALMCMMSVAAAEDRRVVAATTYPLYDMARNICGDLAEVKYVPENAEEAVEAADVVLCMDAEGDTWADTLADVKVVKAVNGLELIEGNTDVLTIPVNCMICASYFAETMGEIDPENKSTYQSNLNTYVEEMISMDHHIREVVSENMKIKCSDGSMAYFAREYGLSEAQDGEEAAELSTYNVPAEELCDTPYIELMHVNLHALADSAD